MKPCWQVALTAAARRDYSLILQWTVEQFGRAQARAYDKTLRSALKARGQGPETSGCRQREEIGPGILTLYVARNGRKGRHFVLFRANAATGSVEVLRLLHDSMDLTRHPMSTGRNT